MRVRFAPSPTGHLHIGGARTALFNYLLAKANQGSFLLRVEDTDEERSKVQFIKSQVQDLKWLGLHWDEGPKEDGTSDFGEFGPYYQSHRKHIYQKYADELLKSGKAYYCFLTDQEISDQKEAASAKKETYQIQSPYRDMPYEQAQKLLKEKPHATVRFKIPSDKKHYHVQDLVRGEVTFQADALSDFVILRSGGMPVYGFCCTIDDALMKITHVFRAEEHLSNTLKQLMLYEALDFDIPQFGHVSMILGEDRKKMSKRHGSTSVSEYREQGYLPEALLNYIALLGWSSKSGEEISSLKNLEKEFSYERFHTASAVFDVQKLRWMNSVYLRNLDHKELWEKIEPFLSEANLEFPDDWKWRDLALETLKTSMVVLSDAVELFAPLSLKGFSLEEKAKEVLSWEQTGNILKAWRDYLAAKDLNSTVTEQELSEFQEKIKQDLGVKGKQLFMPFRVAAIGKSQGTDVKSILGLLSVSVLLKRVNQIIEDENI